MHDTRIVYIPCQVNEIELNALFLVLFYCGFYRTVAATPLPSSSTQRYGAGKKAVSAKLYDAQSAPRDLFGSGPARQKHQTHIGYHVSI